MLLAVQAAHAAGLPRLDLKLQVDRWAICFTTESKGHSDHLCQQVLSGDSAGADPSVELFRRFHLSVMGCSRDSNWQAGDGDLTLHCHFSPPPSWLSRARNYFFDDSHKFLQNLRERCCVARMPIFLNGKLVNSGIPENCPALAFSPSGWKLQPVYYDSGPWIAEKYWLTEATDPDHFLLASRAIRGGDVCKVNGQTYDCQGPEVPTLQRAGHCSAGTHTSSLSILENTLGSQVEIRQWKEQQLHLLYDSSKDLFTSEVQLREDLVLGARSRHMGPKHSGGRVHDYLVFAKGLASSLSRIALDIRRVDPTSRGLQISVPGTCVRRWVALRGVDPLESKLIYVKHGVLLDPVPVEGAVQAVCAIRADQGVQTDFSGLRVVRNEGVEADCQWVRECALDLLDELASYQDPGGCPLGRHFSAPFRKAISQSLELARRSSRSELA